METFFECRTIMTKELYTEFVKATAGRKFRNLYTAIAVVAFLVAALALWTGDTKRALILLGLGILLLLLITFNARIAANRMFRQQQILSGGQTITSDSVCTEEGIQTTSYNGGVSNFSYSQVEAVLESPHLYILRVDKLVAVVFAKDGFTKTTPGGFLSFLRDKCPQAKWMCK